MLGEHVLSHDWCGIDTLGGLGHYLDTIHCIAEQRHVVTTSRIIKLAHKRLERLVLLLVTINQAGLLWLTHYNRWCGNPLWSLVHDGWFNIVCLTLLALCDSRRWRRCGCIALALGLSWIIVDALHVVTKIPVAWEAISGNSSLAAIIGAKEGLVAVAMETVGLTLMAEKTRSGGELEILAGGDLALVWLQVRIHEFTGAGYVVSLAKEEEEGWKCRTRSCT